jgi:three-Cys-motif partner protein
VAKKQDRWQSLCELVRIEDGLPTREVGAWTEKKLFFWNRYLDITTSSMSKKPQWAAGLVYVDLFAGPGICSVRRSSRRIPGSVLIAANQLQQFSKIVACELDALNASACEQRLLRSPAANHCKVVQGDCNEKIDEICGEIPDQALTLAFIDPESLHARFSTVSHLTANRRVDLLILFADRYDIIRNVSLYAKQETSKLDEVLGGDSDWRARWAALPNQNALNTCRLFGDIYKEQLKKHLQFEAFGTKVIRSAKGPLYTLLFASKHPLGLEFWHKVTAKDVSGQGELF